MGFTTSLRNNILNHVFRNEPYTSPSKVYVGLFVGSSEVSGNGYVRQEIKFGAPVGGIIKNNEEVRFPIASDEWGEVTSAGIFDAETGGNRLDDAEIVSVKLVRENDQFIIPIENYTIEVE